MGEAPVISPNANVVDSEIGDGSKIWNFCNVYGCTIGRDTQIGSYCEIRKGASVGDDCRLQSYILIAEGCVVGNLVSIGPGVIFTNDNEPSAFKAREKIWNLRPVRVGDKAVLGAGSVILPGVCIGERAVVAAGSVVTRDVAPGTVVKGSPARKVGNVTDSPYRAGRSWRRAERAPDQSARILDLEQVHAGNRFGRLRSKPTQQVNGANRLASCDEK